MRRSGRNLARVRELKLAGVDHDHGRACNVARVRELKKTSELKRI